MTSGERMVWAAEFVRVLANSCACCGSAESAAWDATRAVESLRSIDRSALVPPVAVMLDEMLSSGGDR